MSESNCHQFNPENLPQQWQPRIIAFLCNWCSYSGADLTGLSRQQYPATVRVIRVPCSGRVDPQYIMRAFMKGADGVLVSGCHPGDCHYLKGNYYSRRKMIYTKYLMELMGFDPRRLQLRWISASEAGKFADTISDISAEITALGPGKKYKI